MRVAETMLTEKDLKTAKTFLRKTKIQGALVVFAERDMKLVAYISDGIHAPVWRATAKKNETLVEFESRIAKHLERIFND